MATRTTMFPAFHHSNVSKIQISVSILRLMDARNTLKTILDVAELLNHYEVEFMTFSCPLSPNAQTPSSIE